MTARALPGDALRVVAVVADQGLTSLVEGHCDAAEAALNAFSATAAEHVSGIPPAVEQDEHLFPPIQAVSDGRAELA